MDEARSTDGDDDSPAADHAVTPVAPDEDPPAADPEPADSDQDEGVAPDREAPEAADSDEGQNAAEPVAPDPDASEIDAGDLREQLLRSEAERLQLEQRLEHESESSRQILEAHATAEGRLAELEGVLTGTQAVRARAESERDELERRLNVEIAARGQEHDERVADAEHRIEALSALLEKQAQETEAERAEHERRAAADGTRIAELEERLKEELAQAAGHAEELQEELRLAREDLRPRAARKLAELQAELEDEREERTDLELRLATLTEAHKALEQARAQESAAARERIAELEPALDEARTGWERAWGELDVLGDRIAETEGTLRERERERDNAVKRVAEVQRALHEAEDGIAVLERALASVTGERDRIETARRVLEARIAARDEAERAFLAERELERRVARSQRQQLTRAERRMTEIASGLGVAMRRLDAPPQPGYDGALQPPRQVGTAPATYAQPAAQPLPPAVAQAPAQAYPRPGATPPAQAYAAPQAVPPAQTYAAPATATPAPSYPGPHAPVAAGAPPAAPAPPVRPGPAPVAGTPAAAQRTMVSGFLRAAERFAARPALEVAGATLSYAELRDRAASIAATLRLQSPTSDPPLTAVFAHRSATAFAGVLGTLMRGHGYVPLNRTLPVARTRTMFERAECQAIVVDAESSAQLPELLADAPHPVVVLVPDVEDVGELRRALPAHIVLGTRQLEPASAWVPEPVEPGAIAYLLFTSGSTGTPKGVMVSHANVLHYVDAMVARYDIDEHDRVSQTHDLTFDVSVFDLFVAWERAACVCCPGQRTMLNPGRYVRDARITVWFSVPSVAIFMRRLGSLKPGSYPDLRWSLFAGEPLPVEVVRAWEEAAPASAIENLYGPTEATVVCALYAWDPATSPSECERGLLPIGRPLPGLSMLIVDEELHEVRPGEQGELLVRGPQVALGYWRDRERTTAAFVLPPGHDALHYRTGDLVRRPRHADGPIAFLGRRDQQVKVRGVRIELGEVESALRDASGVDVVAAFGWPMTLVGADAVEAFVGSDEVDVAAIRGALAERLPAHMVPRRVRALAELPLNPNGKIDRAALVKLLEAE